MVVPSNKGTDLKRAGCDKTARPVSKISGSPLLPCDYFLSNMLSSRCHLQRGTAEQKLTHTFGLPELLAK